MGYFDRRCSHCGSEDVSPGYHCPHCNTPVPPDTNDKAWAKRQTAIKSRNYSTFEVTLFNETHRVKADRLPTPSARTRFYALNVLTGRYLTEERPRRIGLEFETDPTKVEKLTKAPFNWLRGSNFAFRPLFGYGPKEQKNQIVPTGWSDECPLAIKPSLWNNRHLLIEKSPSFIQLLATLWFFDTTESGGDLCGRSMALIFNLIVIGCVLGSLAVF